MNELQFWETLPRQVLQERVSAATAKIATATLEEKQMFDAARDRLLSWREPLKRRGRDMTTNEDETTTTTATDQKPEHPAPAAPTPKKRAAPAAKKEVTDVAAKKKTAKAKPAKKAKTKVANGNGATRIPADAKVTWAGKENPFREGTGAHERTELVRKASGKTRETIEKIKGVMGTTVPTLAKMELVRVS